MCVRVCVTASPTTPLSDFSGSSALSLSSCSLAGCISISTDRFEARIHDVCSGFLYLNHDSKPINADAPKSEKRNITQHAKHNE